jgi:hypothetical protein
MAKHKVGETVFCNTDDQGGHGFPFVVTEVVSESPAQYFGVGFTGRFTDSDTDAPTIPAGTGIDEAPTHIIGPVGEGVERYGLSSL